MNASAPLVLQSTVVRLEPLALEHVPGLLAAARENRATYQFTGVPQEEPLMRAYVETAQREVQAGIANAFATLDRQSGRVVGSTRFANMEHWDWQHPPPAPVPEGPDAVEIGWTWLAHSAQRTAINTHAKLLMLGHAFDVWGVRRVSLKTDARNARSRANIERVGCQLDGVLRAHRAGFDGVVRDTVFYSMLRAEWPAHRARLQSRLASFG